MAANLLLALGLMAYWWVGYHTQPAVATSGRLDACIPFLPYALVPYLCFFGVIPFAVSRLDARGFRVCAAAGLMAAAIALLAFALWPTSVQRPSPLGIECHALRTAYVELQRLDAPGNCCPSLHVAVCTVVWSASWRHGRGKVTLLNAILIAIVVSTVLTKQHSCADLAAGVALGTLAWRACSRPPGLPANRGASTRQRLTDPAAAARPVAMRSAERPVTVVTGASGHLGSLIAAGLYASTPDDVVLAVRPGHSHRDLVLGIHRMAGALRCVCPRRNRRPMMVVEVPDDWSGHQIAGALGQHVTQIVHCAGCVRWNDVVALRRANCDLTRTWLEAARHALARRFVFISSAFSAGYRAGPIAESLYEVEACDACSYTRTKREAEHLVAQSGLPFLIIRPSMVIGQSATGEYTGRPYGPYHIWRVYGGIADSRRTQTLHVVAPKHPLPVIHQDDFQSLAIAAINCLPDGSVMNLVARDTTLPTARTVWDLWERLCAGSLEVVYYDSFADLRIPQLDASNRRVLRANATCFRILSHPWRFDVGKLGQLEQEGFRMPEATKETVARCLRWFTEKQAKKTGQVEAPDDGHGVANERVIL